jgi:hypothetical protein
MAIVPVLRGRSVPSLAGRLRRATSTPWPVPQGQPRTCPRLSVASTHGETYRSFREESKPLMTGGVAVAFEELAQGLGLWQVDCLPPSRAPGCRTSALSAGHSTTSQGETRAATRRVATVPGTLLGEENMNHAPKREIARPVHLGRTRFIPYLSEIPQKKPRARASQEKAAAKIPEHVALGLLALDPPPIPLIDARGRVLLVCSWGIPGYSTPGEGVALASGVARRAMERPWPLRQWPGSAGPCEKGRE